MPSLASLSSFAPPWPPHLAEVTTVAEIVALGLVLFYFKSHHAAVKSVVISAAALFVATCIYLALVSLYTYEIPTTKERFVKGFVCTAEALLVYKEKCPNLGLDELRSAEYDAERLWTIQSITAVQTALIVLWLIAFIVLSLLAGAFAHTTTRERPIHRFLN